MKSSKSEDGKKYARTTIRSSALLEKYGWVQALCQPFCGVACFPLPSIDRAGQSVGTDPGLEAPAADFLPQAPPPPGECLRCRRAPARVRRPGAGRAGCSPPAPHRASAQKGLRVFQEFSSWFSIKFFSICATCARVASPLGPSRPSPKPLRMPCSTAQRMASRA